jgi:arginase
MTGFTLIGAPSSAGTHGVGQEQAPMQLRRAGLLERLLDAGLDVVDDGDLPLMLYRRRSGDRRQQNLDRVVTMAGRVADRVVRTVAAGRVPLVLGGDCTITLGVVAGMLRQQPDLGLLYFDGDADLSTPATSHSGILDAMGVAHLLGDGAPELARLGPRYPLLPARRLVLFGFDPVEVGPQTEAEVARRGLPAWPVTKIIGRAEQAAAEALAALEQVADPVLVHFDVDAVDSTDFPLANFPHFNLGQPLDSAMTCLATFCGSAKLGGLVVTEVNPDHDADGSLLAELVDGLTVALGTKAVVA